MLFTKLCKAGTSANCELFTDRSVGLSLNLLFILVLKAQGSDSTSDEDVSPYVL